MLSNKHITNEQYLVSLHFVQNCRQTYPELDLMEEDIQDMFNKALNTINIYIAQNNEEQLIESLKINKPKGKLQTFKEQALECLKNHEFGEFNELSDEVSRMTNIYAKNNYRKMLCQATSEYQQYVKDLQNGR